jgi:hypothetical protein
MKTNAFERFALTAATGLLFAACERDQTGEDSANVDAPKLVVQGAYEDTTAGRHLLFAQGKATVLAKDGAREKAVFTPGRGKNGPNILVDAEEGASFSGEFDVLQTGVQQSLLLRDASGKTLVLKRLASFCQDAEDCNAQGLKSCDAGKAYACASNACSCKVASSSGSKDAGAKDSGVVSKDAGAKDAGSVKDAGKDAR